MPDGTAFSRPMPLEKRHGSLLLFRSGGGYEASSFPRLARGELLLGANDLVLTGTRTSAAPKEERMR